MIRLSCSIVLMFLVYDNCVFCEYYNNDGSSLFSSLRRTDHDATKTYHFSKINHYEPVNEPIIYADGYNDNTKMIVGFNNMLVFAFFENEKHYVIRVSEDLDEDSGNYASQISNSNDSGELFDVVTLKPTTTTTTTTPFPTFRDRVKDIQREALPGFDPDRQSLSQYLQEVSLNTSRLVKSIENE